MDGCLDKIKTFIIINSRNILACNRTTYVRYVLCFLGKVPRECGAWQHFCFSCNHEDVCVHDIFLSFFCLHLRGVLILKLQTTVRLKKCTMPISGDTTRTFKVEG